jgi:hypothetical protein
VRGNRHRKLWHGKYPRQMFMGIYMGMSMGEISAVEDVCEFQLYKILKIKEDAASPSAVVFLRLS